MGGSRGSTGAYEVLLVASEERRTHWRTWVKAQACSDLANSQVQGLQCACRGSGTSGDERPDGPARSLSVDALDNPIR